MLNILIDTCVWLDIAKDPEQLSTLRVMDELIDRKEITLLLPEMVIKEFNNNKDRISKESNQGLNNAIKRAKMIVMKLGTGNAKNTVLNELEDISFKIPNLTSATTDQIKVIEQLFKKAEILPDTATIQLKAAQRAVFKLAPFHRNKNSIGDAIIIESYWDQIAKGDKEKDHYAFVTHNTSDFSSPNGNQKHPHPDFAAYFDPSYSFYFINLAEALNSIDPDLISDVMIELEGLDVPMRTLSEIIEEENKLFDIIWYHRYKMRVYRITQEVKANRKIKNKAAEIRKQVSEGAIIAAEKKEKIYGTENLGPWNDFELGMLHGKLSALRWVLGDEWDFLDT